jgi:cytochrome b561
MLRGANFSTLLNPNQLNARFSHLKFSLPILFPCYIMTRLSIFPVMAIEIPITNTPQRYGLISLVLHWGMAIAFIGLFLLGKYMVGLDYYDAWYLAAPNLHRSIGVILVLLMLLRWGWRRANIQPGERINSKLALWIQRSFYGWVIIIAISGYLTTTAEGQPLHVFDWFELPATLTGLEQQGDIAGDVHEVLTGLFMALVILHSVAALKHHFIDRDATLLRMLGRRPAQQQSTDHHDEEST